jgi:hypothetical protein
MLSEKMRLIAAYGVRNVRYRYLMASDLTWRTLDIVQGHTLRWLVEIV